MAKVKFGNLQLGLEPVYPKGLEPMPIKEGPKVGLSEDAVRLIIDEAIKGVQPVTIEKKETIVQNVDLTPLTSEIKKLEKEFHDHVNKKIERPPLVLKEIVVDKTQDFTKQMLDVEHNLKNLIYALHEKAKEENRKNLEKIVKRIKIEMCICLLITLVGLFI